MIDILFVFLTASAAMGVIMAPITLFFILLGERSLRIEEE